MLRPVSRAASNPRLRIRLHGAVALFCFVLGTLVVPALHLVDHGRAHVHTAVGVQFGDGQAELGPRSLDEVLQEIRSAAFARRDAAHRANGPQLERAGHAHAPHGSGALLHFASAFAQGQPTLAVYCDVQLLRELLLAPPTVRPTRELPQSQHIRGPPAHA